MHVEEFDLSMEFGTTTFVKIKYLNYNIVNLNQ